MGFAGFLRRNLGLKIFCVALSIFLWFWVRYTQVPLTGKNESQTSIYVSIVYQNEKKGLILTKAPDKVIISVKAPPKLIDEITPDQFKAFVDLADQDEGQNWVDISVRIPPGFTLVDVQPERANILLEKFEAKKFPVEPELRGTVREGFTQGAPVFNPDSVEIDGSVSTLNKISKVVVTLDVTNRDRDLRKLAQPEPRDREGKFIPVKVNPDYVEVDLPIRENIRTATLPITPNITGSPARGFKIGSIDVSPPSATILFSGAETNAPRILKTEKINIKDSRKEVIEKEVNILQPQGGQFVDQRSVRVKINLIREGR